MRKLSKPGPVGLIFRSSVRTAETQTAKKLDVAQSDLYDGQTITLRCPDHPFTTAVLSQVSGPVALTMADPSADLSGKVDLVFDAGPTRYTKPSTLLKVRRDRYEIVRGGVYDAPDHRSPPENDDLLFVCSGNTCRSPMAEAIARDVLATSGCTFSEMELENKGINVISAGKAFQRCPGSTPRPQAVEALKDLGKSI